MADKIAKIKGNEVQDFDLAEATAGTSASVTNTTSVMVKTSTGGYVQIPRDELVKAVASVMASNSQTTFSSLLGVTSSGAPMGIDAANLASVLGGVMFGSFAYFSSVRNDSFTDTGISLNAGDGGRTILAICSGHSGTGSATHSSIYLIRCGYSEDFCEATMLHHSNGSSTVYEWTFGASSNGTLTCKGANGRNKILLIGT